MYAASGFHFFATLAVMAATTTFGQSTPSTNLVNCLHDASVPFAISGDTLYANESTPFNTHIPYAPAAVVVPVTPEHVSSAVKCAGANGFKVQGKGGGHSYASFSTGGQNGSVIISLENFSDVCVDESSWVAEVGAGQRLGNMALALHNQSARALPHGSCPGVGIGGHATHGGYGYSSREWGFALDTIVGLDAVLANGSIIHASADQYPDIFYALRGAADSFGIVTKFYMQTQPAPEALVYFSYTFDASLLTGSGDTAADMLVHLQDFATNATVMSDKIGMGIHIDTTGISFQGIYNGPQDDFNNRINPELLRTLPTPTNHTIEVVDWVQWLVIFATGSGPLNTPLGSGYTEHSNFYAKSLLAPESSPITRDAFLKYIQYIIQNKDLGGSSDWYSILDLIGGPGSQINAVNPDATSFSRRNTLFQFQHYGYSNENDLNFPSNIHPFVQGLNDVIPNAMPDTQFNMYINYIDPALTPQQAHEYYYGDETYSRLLGIKNEVDPSQVFWNPLAIGVQ